MRIEIDDLTRPAVHALLREHLTNMYELSPPESVFALDLDRLRGPDISFWTAWEGEQLLGCGALKELTRHHGEIKSMRTPAALRRKGAGRALLAHMIQTARGRVWRRVHTLPSNPLNASTSGLVSFFADLLPTTGRIRTVCSCPCA
jgi:putative acetyltransferase